MSNSNKHPESLDWSHLAGLGVLGIRGHFSSNPGRWILVDIDGQLLELHRPGEASLTWPVSTALAGVDGTADSFGTPGGLHIIDRKIGSNSPSGMIFKSRQPIGETWSPNSDPGKSQSHDPEEDLVLSRILTLDGLEEGLNRGPGCDSLERFIYIHGTNHEALIGQPVSHGCVRMTNADVIELFDLVHKGDPVVIA